MPLACQALFPCATAAGSGVAAVRQAHAEVAGTKRAAKTSYGDGSFYDQRLPEIRVQAIEDHMREVHVRSPDLHRKSEPIVDRPNTSLRPATSPARKRSRSLPFNEAPPSRTAVTTESPPRAAHDLALLSSHGATQRRPRGKTAVNLSPANERSSSKPSIPREERPQSWAVSHDEVEEEKCGRQMFDKNTLRANGRQAFEASINVWRSRHADDFDESSGKMKDAAVQVYVRKRPMLAHEKNDDFDAATIRPNQVVIHNCLFQADLKTPFINNLTFDFDQVWGSSSENSDVYRTVAAPLVTSSLEGGVNTMFMFGQTGSGKTHTMSAIQEMMAKDIFHGASGEEPWLSVQCIELQGNRCHDLLASKFKSQPELKLREHTDGSYFADGAVELSPESPEELVSILEMAQSRRATSATDANAVSSRSHSVCALRLHRSGGRLMLVDCAGTERKKDSLFHSKERQQESTEINASLHALKECMRLLITQGRVPSHTYRSSALTKVLADSFIRGTASKLAIICTISPIAADTEHSVSTLRMGMALAGRGHEKETKISLSDYSPPQKPRLIQPKRWSPEQVCQWLATADDGRFIDVVDSIPDSFNGQMLVRLGAARFAQLCGGDVARGKRLFDLLHQEMHNAEESRKH